MALLKLFGIAVVLIALAGLGMAIKIWGKKGGEFMGTCASNSPFLNKEGASCALCGAAPAEQCKNTESPA